MDHGPSFCFRCGRHHTSGDCSMKGEWYANSKLPPYDPLTQSFIQQAEAIHLGTIDHLQKEVLVANRDNTALRAALSRLVDTANNHIERQSELTEDRLDDAVVAARQALEPKEEK